MSDYFQERTNKTIIKLRKVLKELPPFCVQFFIGIENTTAPLTRLNYAYDLRIFFHFLVNETGEFPYESMRQFTLQDLNSVTAYQLEWFLSYLSLFEMDGKQYVNNERAKARKASAIKSMFKYFYRKELLEQNITDRIQMPKQHDKEIVRLEVNEVSKLLNQAESGDGLSKGQMRFHEATRLRDMAMLTLFLGTGIRISECVGLNVDDVNFDNYSITVTRKGGSRAVLYFSDEVADALMEYLNDRRTNPRYQGVTDTALFLSLQNRRISCRAVQDLVKKYSSLVTHGKKITPHKLRSTFGTNLYQETKDIYVVADVLGHKDVNTTKKHYAAISDEIRRNAAKTVMLRDRSIRQPYPTDKET